METITIQLSNPMLLDRLHTLAAEYSLSADMLMSWALQRLINDVDFVRSLRDGTIRLE